VKVTNISTKLLYLGDLRILHESQTEGRRGEDRYLGPGRSAYLQNTSETLRSACKGTLRAWKDLGVIQLEDEVTLAASGGLDTVILAHDYGYPPIVYVLKLVGVTWVDATGVVDISHNAGFTETTITNTTAFVLTLLIRLV
jgi:hypothetical protein